LKVRAGNEIVLLVSFKAANVCYSRGSNLRALGDEKLRTMMP
jgi:hypothetical protein